MLTRSRKLLVPFVLLLLSGLTACGSSSSSTTPTTIPNSATVFYAHNLVFRNNTTLSTGYNGFGQLGYGNDNLSPRSIPDYLGQYLPFSGAVAGGNHSIAFINNSTVRTWGYNNFGQLGNSDSSVATHSTSPVPVFWTISGVRQNLSGIKAVAAGAFHSLALRNDDTLWAWGSNDAGQLGADTLTTLGRLYSPEPKMVAAAGVVLANISSIAANGKHSLARASGKVWAWGLNGSGQLGIDPHTTGALNVPTVVAGLPTSGIAGIAAGSAFNYAVGKDGTLWAWGNNGNGQLGNNSTVSTHIPVQVLTASGPLTGIVQATAGIQHGLALDNSGNVWAWGYNHFGQLGNSSAKDSAVAVQVSGVANATEVRAFGSSSMAKVGGAWYVWGDNSFGQLGIANVAKITAPVKMSGF